MWLKVITFMVRQLHLWSIFITFMVGITFMVFITFMGDTRVFVQCDKSENTRLSILIKYILNSTA